MASLETQNSSPPETHDKTTSESLGSKLMSEVHLFGSLPEHIGSGIADAAKEAWNNKAVTALEIGTGVALGAAFTLLSKNPKPLIAASTMWAGRAFVGVAGADLAYRVGAPAVDVWNHQDNLAKDQKELGDNVGGAVFSYGMAFGLGGGGAALGERYLATTKFGSMLQGFDEQNLTGGQVKELLATDAAHETNVSKFVKSFVKHSSFENEDGKLPASLTIRDMGNGNLLGSAKDDVLFSGANGNGMLFKVRHTFGGLTNKANLTDFIHPDGTSENAQTQIKDLFKDIVPQDGSKPTFAGRASGSTGDGVKIPQPEQHGIVSATDSFGDKYFGVPNGKITAIRTPNAELFRVGSADWKINAQPDSQPFKYRLNQLVDDAGKYKKGALAGFGEIMLERAGDIGTSVFTDRLWSNLFKPGETEAAPETNSLEKK